MHPHSTPQTATLDLRARERVLGRARAALAERPAVDARPALAWARVSKSVQDSEVDQLAEIRKDASAHGVTVARERYATGSRWNHKSQEWKALLADIDSGDYGYLWLFKADRLACDDNEMVALVRKALRAGMRVRDTVWGEIDDNNVSVLGMLSHFDIKNTSERTIMRLDHKAESGVKIGGIPWGYEAQCKAHPCKCGLHGHHLPRPECVPVVQDLFRRADEGESLESLRRWFNARTGQRKYATAIKAMLRCEYYAGYVVGRRTRQSKVLGRYGRPRKEWSVERHEHPMVEEGVFWRVQARLDSHDNVGQHRSSGPRHPLVGLVWCVRCGRRMRHHRAREHSEVWQCPLCSASRGSKRLYRKVVDCLSRVAFPDAEAAERYARQAEQRDALLVAEIRAIDADLDRLQHARGVWADMVSCGDMTREDYRANVARNDGQRQELRDRRAALAARGENREGHAGLAGRVLRGLSDLGTWTEGLAHLDEEGRRQVLGSVIRRVELDPERGVLSVCFTEAVAAWHGRESESVEMPSQMAAQRSKS